MAGQNKFDPKTPNAGHRQRLRDRFLKFGPDGFADYELLELLLTFAIPRRDVKPLAKMLLHRFGDLNGVFSAAPEELCQIPGIKTHSAALIKLVDELHTDHPEPVVINSALDAIQFIQERHHDRAIEFTTFIFLDPTNNLLAAKNENGIKENFIIDPRQISKDMIENGASGIVLVHHEPFAKFIFDPVIAQMLLELFHYLRGLELHLIDDIVLSGNTHFSYLNRIGMNFKNYIDYQFRDLPGI